MQLSCPQCGKPLESPVPLPSQAQCPYCMTVFTPTAPVFAPAGARPSWAEAAVQGPAIGLLVVGILNLLLALLGAAGNTRSLVAPQPIVLPPNFPIRIPPELLKPSPEQIAIGLAMNATGAIIGTVSILGAWRMRRLRSYGLAMTSSVLSMIPCVTCCFCLGIPLGLWSIVVLSRAEIRDSFQ